ncbi:uncharacterized protein LOC101860071 [Aplysia californica]|uniref:Uncharacterized protein LOC101860071 n=1 Tax=Aplysia californica TaxID=6500 RepID=A0ABM1W4C2_APLCA|nr:uncharacterized protein LOC101860071 [Aplysia californica]
MNKGSPDSVLTRKLIEVSRSPVPMMCPVPALVENLYISNYLGKAAVPEGTAAFMCETAGSPWANITLYKEDKPLKTSIGKTRSTASLTLPVQLTCEDSGRYQCHAENGVGPQNLRTQWKTLDVHVKCEETALFCKPRACDDTEMAEGFGSLGKDAIISVCVIAFPEPYEMRLSQNGKAVRLDRYNTRFSYTKQPRGIVTITLKSVTQQDFNSPYKLYIENSDGQYSYTEVKLSPRGPPRCPRSLEVSKVSSNFVTLQWRAGSDRGQKQTFFVLRHSGLNDSHESGRHQEVAASDVTQNSRQAVNVTGLQQKTDYFFSVTARNGFGSAQNCKIVQVSTIAATGAEALSDSEDSTPTVMIVVVVIVILIVIVVAAVVVIVLSRRWRRDRAADRLSQDDPSTYPRDATLVMEPVDDPRRVIGQPTETGNSSGHEYENPYDEVNEMPASDIHTPIPIMSAMAKIAIASPSLSTDHEYEHPYNDATSMLASDIHTHVLIMSTKAEIVTPEAPQANTDTNPYKNVSASAPRSRAGQEGQVRVIDPAGAYDVLAAPDSVAFVSDPYTSLLPERENSQADEVDDSYLNARAGSAEPEGYVNMEGIKKEDDTPYENA